VDSIHDTKDGLGGAVFSAIEGADVGGALDGNWGKKSIDAAASGGQRFLDALRAMGVPEDQIAVFALVAQSVANRLQGHRGAYERIDHESTWWERNGGTVLAVVSVVVSVAAIGFSIASLGSCALVCAGIAAGVSSISAGLTCTTSSAGQCGVAVGSAVVSILTFGAASAGGGLVSGGLAMGSLALDAQASGNFIRASAWLAGANGLLRSGNSIYNGAASLTRAQVALDSAWLAFNVI